MREGGVAMTGGTRHRWRLTRRGRVVFSTLGVLVLTGVGSLAAGPAADLARAAGLSGDTGDLTLVASGDVLPHGPVLRRAAADGARAGQPYDFRPMFAELRPVVAAADLAVCHLETPMSGDGRDVASWPSFNAPPQLAQALRWAGYDACSTASNHAMDRGPGGVAATIDVLDRAGLRHDGTTRDAILGHHVHVVQPIEQVGGKWVAYGMGNSLSNQTPACCAAGSQDGVVVQVTIARDGDRPRVRAVRYVPTWVEHPSFRVRPVPAALADRSLTPEARQALEASRDRTSRAVGPAVPPPAAA
jgi:hypothetical protein